jgi:hypothetical protein
MTVRRPTGPLIPVSLSNLLARCYPVTLITRPDPRRVNLTTRGAFQV